MQTIYKLITLESENEHDLEHDLEQKRQFSEPRIFDADGDLTKRWYVYFSYRNPKSGKLQRMKNIYGKTNRFKNKAERYAILNIYKKRLSKFLKEGYNPFGDNADLYKSQQNNKVQENTKAEKSVVEQKKEQKTIVLQKSTFSIQEAFDKAIALKVNIISATTLKDYKSRVNQFESWFNAKTSANNSTTTNINEITKKVMVEFLNNVQLRTSARNRNNYRTVFSSLFQVLEDNDIIEKNFVSQIKAIRTKPVRHKTYSLKDQESIFDYLEKNDKLLLLYIKFISYNFLRPIEVNRLRIKDINTEQGTLQFQAKNKTLKTKIIPELLLKELPDLSKFDGDMLLFTPDGFGGEWDTQLTNRRDYFSKRFKTVVKIPFELDQNYGLYSFRHTFITKLYRALLKNSSPFEAKSRLMLITGHNTMLALEKYLRDIDAELPNDYSDHL